MLAFKKWFCSQPVLLQSILLLIPGIGWICELLIRIPTAINKLTVINVIMAILALPGGIALQYVDLIINLLTKKLLFI